MPNLQWLGAKVLFGLIAMATIVLGVLLWLAWGRTMTSAPMSGGDERLQPSIADRMRWVCLAVIPASLVQSTSSFINDHVMSFPDVHLFLLAIWALSLVMAFARNRQLVNSKPVVSSAVQLLSVLFFVANPLLMSIIVPSAPLHFAILIPLVLVIALPHRTMLILQPFLAVVALTGFFNDLFEGNLLAMLALCAAAATCWGCHGELTSKSTNPRAALEVIVWLGIGHLVGWSLNFFSVYLLRLPMVDFSLLLILSCLLRVFPLGKNFSAYRQDQRLEQG
ncbi:MAG: hypothetical protein L0Y72_13720 [Gemmataceae bacterium]|nr:hypothetical protein [Gemmataceae bacterium]